MQRNHVIFHALYCGLCRTPVSMQGEEEAEREGEGESVCILLCCIYLPVLFLSFLVGCVYIHILHSLMFHYCSCVYFIDNQSHWR